MKNNKNLEQKSTDRLLMLLKEEKVYTTNIKKLELKGILTTYESDLYNFSKKQLNLIEFYLSVYSHDEIALGKVLTNKEPFNAKKLMFNTACIDYIKKINDFELDEEKAKKIKSYQTMLCLMIISFGGVKRLNSSDIQTLINGVLTENQFSQLLWDLRLDDTDKALNEVKANTNINNYKGD